MKTSTRRRTVAGAVTATTVLLLLAAPAAAQATTSNPWGIWTVDNTGLAGEVGFDAGLIHASWSASHISPGLSPEIVTHLTQAGTDINTDTYDQEFFTTDTPIGAVFGTNGPSATNNYLKVGIPQLRHSPLRYGLTDITVTFDSPIEAAKLGLAVSDVDSDDVYVSAFDANDNTITGTELQGTAAALPADLAFNFCPQVTQTAPDVCNSDTDVPPISVEGGGVYVGDGSNTSLWGTTGASAWLRPSVAVKKLVFSMTNYDTSTSSIRLWLAQFAADPVIVPPVTGEPTGGASSATAPALANTGATSTTGSAVTGLVVTLAGLVLLVAGAAAGRTSLRRRIR